MINIQIELAQSAEAEALIKILKGLSFVHSVQTQTYVSSVPIENTEAEKIAMMKKAQNDPLFLEDLQEVCEDFGQINFENLK